MERRQYVATLGTFVATGLAGCGSDDPADETATPTGTPTPTPTRTDGEQPSFPDTIQRLLLEEDALPEEEGWSLVRANNQQEGWYTYEFERNDEDGRLHVMYSDVWVYDGNEAATDDYESRESGYQENRETTALDVGERGIGWVDRIAVALFYEENALGQIEYQVYDDGELTGATLDLARSYAGLMYEDW